MPKLQPRDVAMRQRIRRLLTSELPSGAGGARADYAAVDLAKIVGTAIGHGRVPMSERDRPLGPEAA